MREIRSRRHTGSTWVTRGGSPWAAIDTNTDKKRSSLLQTLAVP